MKKINEWTPGPWIVHGNEETLKYNISGKGESYFVAHIISHGRPLETIESNARLIAAAPEMLDALIKIIPQLEKYLDADSGQEEQYTALYVAGQAVEKATVKKI